MADFRSWRVDFDANESALVRQKRVSDPPGHDLAAARDMVRLPLLLAPLIPNMAGC